MLFLYMFLLRSFLCRNSCIERFFNHYKCELNLFVLFCLICLIVNTKYIWDQLRYLPIFRKSFYVDSFPPTFHYMSCFLFTLSLEVFQVLLAKNILPIYSGFLNLFLVSRQIFSCTKLDHLVLFNHTPCSHTSLLAP